MNKETLLALIDSGLSPNEIKKLIKKKYWLPNIFASWCQDKKIKEEFLSFS